MTFTARYSGSCAYDDCNSGLIEPGDDVEYNEDDELMHHSCATRQRRQALPPYCDICHTHHRGEC